MPIAEELQVLIRAETQNAVRNLEAFNKKTKEVEKSSASFVKGLVAGGAAAAASYVSFRALSQLIGSSVKAYQEQERAERLLAAALKASGEVVESRLPGLKRFASSIQAVTTVGDEAAMDLTRLAYSFGLSGRQAEEAVKGAIGLSQAFGVDVQTALRGVANAYGGNYEQLSRYIPALRTATTEAEKNAALQKAMADGFTLAKENAKTSGGQIDQLANAYGDLKETLGAIILNQANPFISWLKEVTINTANAAAKTFELADAQRKMMTGKANEVSLEVQHAVLQERIKDAMAGMELFRRSNPRQAEVLRLEVMGYREQSKAILEQIKLRDRALAQQKEAAKVEAARNQARKPLGEGFASDMIDAGGPLLYIPESEYVPAQEAQEDAWAAHLAAMQAEAEQYNANVTTLHEQEVKAAQTAAAQIAAAYTAAYGIISTNVLDLWQMQLNYNREVGDAEIERMRRQMDAFQENYDNELRLKEELGIDTVAFQEEMNAKQAAMEEAMLARENAIKKRQFEQEKKMSIAQTLMAGSEAAVKAWTAGPFVGPALSALIAAFTAAKVGMIASQKYPALAEGGIVDPSPGGSLVRVAEAGKPELITPLDKAGLGGITVVINAEVVGGREEVAMWVHEGIRRAQRMGKI